MTTSDAGRDLWGAADWKRATACADTSCVEVAFVDDLVGVRDSKDPRSGVLVFSRAEWSAFSAGVRRGDFDA